MNHIEVKAIPTQYGYEERYWVIDGKSLPEYLDMWVGESEDSFLKSIQPFLGLCPAWSKQLNWEGDIRFVWKLIEMDLVVLPLLVCEDDLDFDCIVIVVDVKKQRILCVGKELAMYCMITRILKKKRKMES